MYDLLLRHSRIIDGTGNPWFYGDAAVEGDRIAAVGDLSGVVARRTIDLEGLALAPGFIDLHTHSDFTLPAFPRAEAMLRQGVTTQLVGNCGFSPFPVRRERLALVREYSAFLGRDLPWKWEGAGDYARFLESLPLACNVALQVGHGAVRIAAMGFENREASPEELGTMQQLVAQAFEEGVFALSTGLIYAPGSYSSTEELIALAGVAARYGGFYSSHIRGEGGTLLSAMEEALTVGGRAGVPVQLSHHKATGKRHWGMVQKSLALIDAARAAGQDVLADQYPYTAGSTTLASIMPKWAMEGGIEGMLARLADPETSARIREDLLRDRPGEREFDPDAMMISYVPNQPDKGCEGMMLKDIAAQRGQEPAEAALDLLRAGAGGIQMILFTMSEEDVRRVMHHPAVAVASDGWTLSPEAGGRPHPRSYGTYVRVLGKYVREEGVLRLEDAVRKMTSLPAQRLRRYDMGLVRRDCLANLAAFDPATIAERATFQDPHQYCEGVHYVVVNGQVVIENGWDTGAQAGRVLRRNT